MQSKNCYQASKNFGLKIAVHSLKIAGLKIIARVCVRVYVGAYVGAYMGALPILLTLAK